MDKKKIFIILAIFWLVIIGGFVLVKEYTLRSGQEVLLKTRALDPRDLFRGDYVTLRYDISTLDLNSVSSDEVDFKSGDKIYLLLTSGENYSTPSKIHTSPPKEGLFLKGIVRNVSKDRLIVEYGIESYFVPEGRGKIIERRLGTSVDVKVSIDKFGNAVIKSLLIEGKDVRFDS